MLNQEPNEGDRVTGCVIALTIAGVLLVIMVLLLAWLFVGWRPLY